MSKLALISVIMIKNCLFSLFVKLKMQIRKFLVKHWGFICANFNKRRISETKNITFESCKSNFKNFVKSLIRRAELQKAIKLH